MKKRPYRRLKPRLDPAGEGYPMPMRGLLTLGKPKAEASYTEWADQLREYVPQLIQMVLDPHLNERPERDSAVWAPIHAMEILAELAAVEAVEPLLDVLDWDDDWIDERLVEFFRAVGPAAVPALQAYAEEQSNDPVGRGRAISALGGIASTHADVRGAVSAFLTNYIDRPQADTEEGETLTAWAIIELSSLKADDALPAIRRAFDEQRVNTTLIGVDDVERFMGLAPETEEVTGEEPGVTLTLRCKACERERQYTFERAYFDIGTIRNRAGEEHSALIIPERVVCPKCGAVDQYELGALSHFAVMAKLIAPSTGLPDPLPGLILTDFTTERWGWMPPRDALARYASEVAAHPSDVGLRVGYGNALRMMGYREEAMDQYEQALMIDPYAGEARINIAQMKSLDADFNEAIAEWERLKRDLDGLSLEPEDRELRRLEVDGILDELRLGVRPDYRGKPLPRGEQDLPQALPSKVEALEPSPADYQEHFLSTPVRPAISEYGKVGRNEPCPCGSGKKYKQCHGRK